MIDDLKKEKAELCKRNKELLESKISMRQTISQLSQTNKQLEEEKSSWVTAVKIIQNEFNQLSANNARFKRRIFHAPIAIQARDN